MLRKLALACGLLITTISTANAAFYAGPSLAVIDNTSGNGSYRAIQPIIHVGYNELMYGCTYLALEAFGVPSSLQLDDNTKNSTSIRSTYSFGASFIPGYLITDNVIGYLRLGIVNTSFPSASTTRAGGQFGIGLQTALTETWQLRGEYDYMTYSSAGSIGGVKTDQFMLGLIYNFIN